MMYPHVLYEDHSVIVLDKPVGMVVNRSLSIREGENTLADWIESRPEWVSPRWGVDPQHSYFFTRSGIVHRLDKETSGVLVVAKTPESFFQLLAQFAKREVIKTYSTLVHGLLHPKEGTVCLPLSRSRLDRRRFSVAILGKRAETHWQVVRFYKRCVKPDVQTKGYQGFSLVRVFPQTGRTHQIRVHLAFLGHPVVSDERYGGRRSKEDRKWCPRQFLHAQRLSFVHPVSGKRVEFEAKLPADLRAALVFLE